MRVLLVILAVLTGGCTAAAQHRATLGIDIAEAMRSGNIKVMTSYGFHERWSVRYDSTISTYAVRLKENPEDEIHNAEFVPEEESEAAVLTTGISFQYWPKRLYDGIYAEIGCRHDSRSMPYCIARIGYCIPIWKGFSAIVSYSTDINSYITDRKVGKGYLGMEICWTFGNI